MLRIAIVDDDGAFGKAFRLQLEEGLRRVACPAADCFCFTTYERMRRLAEAEGPFDLLFLDVCLDEEKNGIELTRLTHRLWPKTAVVLMSTGAEYVYEGYGVEALNFLCKPIDQARLEDVLGRFVRKRSARRMLRVKQLNGPQVQIPMHDIYYMEHYYGRTQIARASGSVESGSTLTELEKLANCASLLRCHESYLVNLDRVLAIRRYHFILGDGRKVPISKLRFAEIREAYENHLLSL